MDNENMECHLAINNNVTITFLSKEVELKIITLSKVTQAQKDKYLYMDISTLTCKVQIYICFNMSKHGSLVAIMGGEGILLEIGNSVYCYKDN